jgi:hypothetical protein
MLRKDYILKQFEEFGKVMALILSFKRSNDWEKFEEEIQAALQRFTSLEPAFVESLKEEEFEEKILKNPALSFEQQKILADLLFEKLNYYMEKNDREKYIDLKNKCSKLYQFIVENLTQNEFDLNAYYKLELLKKM